MSVESQDETRELPLIDARSRWRDDHEELGTYRLSGRCNNCLSEAIGWFTRGYRPNDLTYFSKAMCPACGCDSMSWRGLTE